MPNPSIAAKKKEDIEDISPWSPQLTKIYSLWPRLSSRQRGSVIELVEKCHKKAQTRIIHTGKEKE